MTALCSNCGGQGVTRNRRCDRTAGDPGWLPCPQCKCGGLHIPDSQRISRDDNPDRILFPEEHVQSPATAQAEGLLRRLTDSPMGRFYNGGFGGGFDDEGFDDD